MLRERERERERERGREGEVEKESAYRKSSEGRNLSVAM